MELIAGKYKPLRKLGQGGAGTVYLVEHIDLGRQYALKLLSPALSSDEKAIQRFKQEAQVMEQFSHPGSVPLRDFGKTENGLYYMTTDYCDGPALKELVKSYGPRQLDDVYDCALQILSVLKAAHAMGIIHRDVKPENIIVERDADGNKRYRLLDFGIAKLREALPSTGGMTMEGVALGTPEYMSPEQVAGEASLDHRVDLYAVGVLIYELVTGHAPFEHHNMLQTLLMHSTKAPPPFAAECGVSPRLEKLVMRALEKDRSLRYRDAEEFIQAVLRLREAGADAAVEAAPAPTVGTEAVSAPAGSAARSQPAPPAPAAAADADQRFKILCLDDDEAVLHLMKHLLEQQGYKVYPISNCSAIHDLLFREKVRFMISDVQMPGLPGPKICQMLKESLRDITIVLFSSIDESDLEAAAKEARADAWISKQWKPQEWVESIRGLVARHQSSE